MTIPNLYIREAFQVVASPNESKYLKILVSSQLMVTACHVHTVQEGLLV